MTRDNLWKHGADPRFNFWAELERFYPEAGAAWDRDIPDVIPKLAFETDDKSVLIVVSELLSNRYSFSNLIPHWNWIDRPQFKMGTYTDSRSVFLSEYAWGKINRDIYRECRFEVPNPCYWQHWLEDQEIRMIKAVEENNETLAHQLAKAIADMRDLMLNK